MELVTLNVRPGGAHDSQSGLQLLHPRIWGAFHRTHGQSKTAAVISHPTSNFMGHYLLGPLAERNISAFGLSTRYLGSDVTLLLERAIQDLGAGVQWLRRQGFERIILIGNSGGGALVSLYQAQAENLTLTHTPAGDPVDLLPEDLLPAEGIVLSAAHLGRSRLLEKWIDPAVIDESDPLSSDPTLDMFNPENGPPFPSEFMRVYRLAQSARLSRLECWAKAKLRQLRSVESNPRDMAFIIHRTLADPRCLDPSIDANDREPGTTVWGPPRQQNFAPNSMGRFTTLTAFLSQWAPCSHGDGPTNLALTSVPVLLVEHSADASTFPSDHELWAGAAAGRITRRTLKGGTHYLQGRPDLVTQLADEIEAFANRI